MRTDTNAYGHTYGDNDGNTNGNAYADFNAYSYADGDTYTDSHADSGNADGDANLPAGRTDNNTLRLE